METRMDKTTTDSAQLHAFVRNLDDVEWQAVQDRMVDPMSQADIVQVSGRIHSVVSQLLLQLISPALQLIQLQPEDQSRATSSVSKKQPQGNNSRDMIAEWEDIQEEQAADVISGAVSALLHQVDLHSNDRGRSTLTKLEDLIRKDKLSIFSSLLKTSLSPLLSSPVSPAVQIDMICDTAVKHLLRLVFFPPLSWGMGQVLRVQSSHSAAVRYRETARLYDDIISQYAQLMCGQVMSSLSRSPEKADDSERQHKKKRKNIVHFFQKLPRKIQNNWKAPINWIDTLWTV